MFREHVPLEALDGADDSAALGTSGIALVHEPVTPHMNGTRRMLATHSTNPTIRSSIFTASDVLPRYRAYRTTGLPLHRFFGKRHVVSHAHMLVELEYGAED